MRHKITVVDYGVGNLYSVRRALESCGVQDIAVSSEPADVDGADRLILPGVGAFADGMDGLRVRGLVEPIARFARSGRPLLGICLGMQMLASESEEFGRHPGLDLIGGKVLPIPARSTDGRRLKVPFIGWTELQGDRRQFDQSCLRGLDEQDSVYLVHSFFMQPDAEAHVLAHYRYGSHDITAAVRKANITGLQFHPEKSGRVGLQIIANFVADGMRP